MLRGPLVLGSQQLGASWLDGAIVLEHREWTCEDQAFGPTLSTHTRITLTDRGGTDRTLVHIDGRVAYDREDRS